MSQQSPPRFSRLLLLSILLSALQFVKLPQQAHAGAGGIEINECSPNNCLGSTWCASGSLPIGNPDSFIQGPPLNTPRAFFASTALQVYTPISPDSCSAATQFFQFGLVSGGITDASGDVTNSAELFGPVFSPQGENGGSFGPVFSAVGSMNTPRTMHQATLFFSGGTGMALITGGSSNLAAGRHSISALSSAEIFQFQFTYGTGSCNGICSNSTGQFSFTANPMNTARTLHQATLLQNGKVLITGGLNNQRVALNTAEIYDPNAGTFTLTKGKMKHARFGHTATLLTDGTVLIAGGASSGEAYPYLNGRAGVTASAELYNPTTDTFAEVGRMHVARAGHTASRIASSSSVLIAGGISGGNVTDTAELYTPGIGFSMVGKMNTPRFLHSAASLETGQVLIVGGSSDPNLQTSLDTRELFEVSAFVKSNPMTDPTMTVKRRGFAAGTAIPVEYSDLVVVSGGVDSSGTPQTSSNFYLPQP